MLLNFNANEVAPAAAFETLPAGWYTVEISDSEMKMTKAGDGQYLQLTLNILSGPHAGRKVWDRLNLDNPNNTAVEIAQRTLSAICHAVGVLSVRDSNQLHNKPLEVKLGIKNDSNEVKGYRALTGAAPAVSAVVKPSTPPFLAGAKQPPAQPAAKPSMPWAQ